jgi:hypothetical protein
VLPKELAPQLPPSGAKGLGKSAAQSDPSQLALMRARWARRSNNLAIAYSGSLIKSELALPRGSLWSGAWELELHVDGEPLMPVSKWESVCWVADRDVVYFELEMALSGGARVQRQIFLERKDRFAVMSDTLLGRTAGEIRYRSALPLAPNVSADPAGETREVALQTPSGPMRVVPCALGEWRHEPGGTFGVLDSSLVYERSVPGTNLFSPLFFDLDPKRSSEPLTWRRLTVAENRAIQPLDVVAGYRIQVGRRQWLVYRAMAERAGRTVLGANTWSQFLVMRIKPSGQLVTLLEIE